MMYKFALLVILSTLVLFALTAHAATTGPVIIDDIPPPCTEEKTDAETAESVQLLGRTLCSEYGTPHKGPLLALFVAGDFRRTAEINQDDGLFHVRLPAGHEYTFSIGMDGKSFKVGVFTLPAGGHSKKVLEIYHPGSMLELVWEARAGDDQGGTDFKLKDE
ncbi:MAG: hypothetical protein HZA22_01880 [Nitrospirae bacterium]|nr:hypothetical protein [Nitrospirota bacterium]